jgi:hypothetical protein
LSNWAIEPREFDKEFVPRNAIKGQSLADFMVEFTNLPEIEEWLKDETWVIYVDGSSTKKNGEARVVLVTLEGEELCSSLRLAFKTTNNEAEYEAVLVGVSMAQQMGAKFVEVQSDS